MVSARTLPSVLATVARIPLRGPWYRAVNYDLLQAPPPGAPAGSPPQPLWAGGAARTGARFTPRASASGSSRSHGPAIDSLYLAEDEITPLLEVTGVFRPPGSNVRLRFEPLLMMTVDGALSDVVDLTDAATQSALGTTEAELTGPWLLQQSAHLTGHGPLPPTQTLGMEAFRAGNIVGLRYRSSKSPAGVGVVVFTNRLVSRRHVLEVFNQRSGRLQQALP